MEIIDLQPEQMDEAALFCTSGKRGKLAEGIAAKSAWAVGLYHRGLRIKLARSGNQRAGFTEYGPSESISVRAVHAPQHWMVNCLWVQPAFKGKGLGGALIQAVVDHARQDPSVHGLVTVASDRTWLSGTSVFRKAGFQEVDRRDDFSLMSYDLDGEAITPSFLPWTGPPQVQPSVLTLVWHPQCPFNAFYAAETRAVCADLGVPFTEVQLNGSSPTCTGSAFGAYALYWGDELLTWQPRSASRLRELLERRQIEGAK